MNIDLYDLIPHRPPMLLIDEVVELDVENRSIIATRAITEEDHFVQGHYPGAPLVPGVISCEMMFQAGAALMAYLIKNNHINPGGGEDFVPVVSRITSAKFKGMILPGKTVELKTHLAEQVSRAFYLKGEARVDGKVCASVDFTCMLAPRPKSE